MVKRTLSLRYIPLSHIAVYLKFLQPAFYAASADICEYIREEESDYLGEYDTSVIQCKRSGASFALNDSTAYNKKGVSVHLKTISFHFLIFDS